MPKDDEKLIRQLSLVSFLLNRSRPATTREIQTAVEGYDGMSDAAFTRRFFQDRQDLLSAGIGIITVPDVRDESGEAYYLPEENYYLPDLDFTQEELSSLRVALALLHGRFAYERPLLLALACLTHGRPAPGDPEGDGIAVAVGPEIETDGTLAALARVDEAARRGKTLRFEYHSMHRDMVSVRTVDPYCLIRSAGHWYTVGRDHGSDSVRMFRLSRIHGPLAFTGKNARDFHVPPGFSARDYTARPRWLLAEAVGQARFRVSEDLAWWIERSYPRVRRIEKDPALRECEADGWAYFSTDYSDADALLGWIIGLGGRAELLDPPLLRALLLDRLDRIWCSHCTPSAIPGVDLP
jgi:proteasome accessory factor BC